MTKNGGMGTGPLPSAPFSLLYNRKGSRKRTLLPSFPFLPHVADGGLKNESRFETGRRGRGGGVRGLKADPTAEEEGREGGLRITTFVR